MAGLPPTETTAIVFGPLRKTSAVTTGSSVSVESAKERILEALEERFRQFEDSGREELNLSGISLASLSEEESEVLSPIRGRPRDFSQLKKLDLSQCHLSECMSEESKETLLSFLTLVLGIIEVSQGRPRKTFELINLSNNDFFKNSDLFHEVVDSLYNLHPRMLLLHGNHLSLASLEEVADLVNRNLNILQISLDESPTLSEVRESLSKVLNARCGSILSVPLPPLKAELPAP